MTTEDGELTTIGIDISVIFADDDPEKREWIQKQLGKYELNERYSFCYECWLDSLFGNQQYDIAKLASEIARLHKVESDIMKGKIPR